jgi:hypothetical protein
VKCETQTGRLTVTETKTFFAGIPIKFSAKLSADGTTAVGELAFYRPLTAPLSRPRTEDEKYASVDIAQFHLPENDWIGVLRRFAIKDPVTGREVISLSATSSQSTSAGRTITAQSEP